VPRIRSIKPELLRSPKFAQISAGATGLLLGLMPHCDDYGGYAYDWRLVKADVFSMHDTVGQLDIVGMVEELVSARLLCWYWVDGQAHLHVVGWDEWQKVDSPAKWRFPACPRQLHGGREHPHEDLPEVASPGESSQEVDPRARAQEYEHEYEHEEERDLNPLVADKRRRQAENDPAHGVWMTYTWARKQAGVTGERTLTPGRAELIRRRIKTFGLQTVAQAAHGWVHDPWDGRAGQCEIEQILKLTNVEKFATWHRDGHGPLAPTGNRKQAANGEYGANPRELIAWAEEQERRQRHDDQGDRGDDDADGVGEAGGGHHRGLPQPAAPDGDA
jgi:hypothetical protein